MKSAVETVSPTRVRLTVEVPFDELTPSVDAAYKKIARQVRVQGFRPGKVPPRILDQRVGRATVLEEAVQEAIPHFYGDAVRENEVAVVGHPEVDVTRFADGAELVFTAEVDVRPTLALPAYDGLAVTVEDAEVSDTEVDEQLATQRDRFAVLAAVDRPAEPGDYVSLDIAGAVDGRPVPGAEATGLSHELGTGSLMPGLDEVVAGMSDGESRTFDSVLVAGEFAGRTAQVSVTVRSVKAKQLPDLDDDFAQTASEFDTIEELRADVRHRLDRFKKLQQGVQAREAVIQALLAGTEVPAPPSLVDAEARWRRHSLGQRLESAGLTEEDYLGSNGRTPEQLEAELRDSATAAVQAQLLLDAIADAEQVGVDDAGLTEQVVLRAQREGVPPEEYAQRLVQSGQLGAFVAEIRRGKVLESVVSSAAVTDASGRPVDLAALRAGPVPATDVEGPGPVSADGG